MLHDFQSMKPFLENIGQNPEENNILNCNEASLTANSWLDRLIYIVTILNGS